LRNDSNLIPWRFSACSGSKKTKMNHTLNTHLLQFSVFLQRDLFAWQEAEGLKIMLKLPEVIKVLEFVQIERCRVIRVVSADLENAGRK